VPGIRQDRGEESTVDESEEEGGTRTMTAPLLRITRLQKVYKSGVHDLVLFDALSFEVLKGEMLAIVGESGSGKSTLLHLLGALDRPTAGEIHFNGTAVHNLAPDAAAAYRSRDIGFVWQFHYLLPEFSAEENVAMPLLMNNTSPVKALAEARRWLAQVNLADRATHRPGELSGGEQQRVALARALITGPKLLMADEPTGDLDAKTAELVFSLIARLHRELGLTSIIVTHNMEFARRCDRILRLAGGKLLAE
jgi:lipoprotein-releasing system ATP-binding protein